VNARRLAEIEDVIFEKIRQRTHGADDEGKTVRKIFKHFDLDGFGTIEFSEFTRALESIGCTFPEHEQRAVFAKYDKDGNNKLDYEEFSAWFAIRGSGNNPNVNPVFGIQREPPNQVLQKILDTMKARGAHGIRGLGIVFRRMDNNGDKKMDRNEFMWGLRENGHNLSPSEFERIFKYFDKNNDGKISYDEFLRGIRGDMNARRLALVKLAYQKLDRDHSGMVDLNDIAIAYDVTQHPKFKTGEMSRNDILTEFMAQWDTNIRDNKVTLAEFQDYYKDVSASIDEDDYFELMIRNAWHLDGGEGQFENTTIKRELVTDADGTQRV
jgi:Ca2+-binding EF-hand superfamily protein